MKLWARVWCLVFDSQLVLGLRGVLCATIWPLSLTLDPCRGPIGDFRKLSGQLIVQSCYSNGSLSPHRCGLTPSVCAKTGRVQRGVQYISPRDPFVGDPGPISRHG